MAGLARDGDDAGANKEEEELFEEETAEKKELDKGE
jgi:hypothetical protein